MADLPPEDFDNSKLPWWIPRWSIGWFLNPNRPRQIIAAAIVFGILGFILVAIHVVTMGLVDGQNQFFRKLLVIPALIGEIATLVWILQPTFIQKMRFQWMAPMLLWVPFNLLQNLRKQTLSQSLVETLLGFLACLAIVIGIHWYDRKQTKSLEGN